ncbi:MAG: flagella basal body P-ring formation protein FlgA [Deltaproteobacteria bacterium]|nr:MAG: flagella basal body P-ring formation protein FlgA [Deltaproteobacteria bacterium]
MVLLSLALLAATSHAADAEPLFRTAIREYIEANMPWPPGTVRVDFLSEEQESIPQNRDLILRVEPAGNQDFIGDMVFLVKSFRGGNLLRTESVRTRIEVLQDVVTAGRGLPAGTVLAGSDIRTVRRWVRRIHPHSLPSMEAASGKRLTMQVASGAEILATMLKEIPLVRKGKMVKIVFDNGPMQIVTVGLSEEDGVAGNIVRVKNITSNKIIYARVLSDSVVGIGF